MVYDVKSGRTRLVDQHKEQALLDPQHHSPLKKTLSKQGAAFYSCLSEDLKKLPERKLKKSLTDWLLDMSTPLKKFLTREL